MIIANIWQWWNEFLALFHTEWHGKSDIFPLFDLISNADKFLLLFFLFFFFSFYNYHPIVLIKTLYKQTCATSPPPTTAITSTAFTTSVCFKK